MNSPNSSSESWSPTACNTCEGRQAVRATVGADWAEQRKRASSGSVTSGHTAAAFGKRCGTACEMRGETRHLQHVRGYEKGKSEKRGAVGSYRSELGNVQRVAAIPVHHLFVRRQISVN
eukprot:967208-Prorocentrum_minimum.AAC.1